MKSEFEQLVSSAPIVVIDFFAHWCGPCQAMGPELQKLAGQVDENVKIVKIDVDKNQPVARKYQVSSIPTLMFFKNGQLKKRQTGVLNAKQMKHIIEQL